MRQDVGCLLAKMYFALFCENIGSFGVTACPQMSPISLFAGFWPDWFSFSLTYINLSLLQEKVIIIKCFSAKEKLQFVSENIRIQHTCSLDIHVPSLQVEA